MEYFTVKQISFNKEEGDLPNVYGWDGAIERSPKWKAKMAYMHFQADEGDVFNKDDLALYNDKYLVQAENLDDVFRLTNLWDDEDRIHRYEVGHSTSVGDIIENNRTGEQYIVSGWGFDKVAQYIEYWVFRWPPNLNTTNRLAKREWVTLYNTYPPLRIGTVLF